MKSVPSRRSPPTLGDDLPTDFASFLATRRGSSPEHALQSIGQWLIAYEPLCTLTHRRQWYPEVDQSGRIA